MGKNPRRHQGHAPVARRTVCGVSLLLSLVACVSPVAWGADDAMSRETLRRLEGVRVLVEDFTPEVGRDGLTRQQVQTAVERRLRTAGIQVLTEREWATTPGNPYLAVRVNARQTTGELSGLYAYAIAVEFKQTAVLVRDSDLRAMGAATWSVGASGSVDRDHLRQIGAAVDAQIDHFITAYRSVNPAPTVDPEPAVNPEPAGRLDTRQPGRMPVQDAQIRQTQERLAAQGFDPGPLDGRMGAKTQAALRQFQRAHGLPMTGKLDEATRTALGRE
jgi:hypothetical protein